MKDGTLQNKVLRKHLMLIVSIGVILNLVLGFSFFHMQKTEQNKRAVLWVSSFQENVLAYLMESDYFSIESQTRLLQSTMMFSRFVVYDVNGKYVSGFGSQTGGSFDTEIADESGEVWGKIYYQFSYDYLFQEVLRFMTLVILTTMILLLLVGWKSRRDLNVLLSSFSKFVGKIVELNQKIERKVGQNQLTLKEIIAELKRDKFNTDESVQIRNSVVSLVEKISEGQRRIFEVQREIAKSEKENIKLDTIVRTTQMLAHDLRKPFSMFKQFVHVLNTADREQLAGFTSLFIKDFRKSIDSSENMIDRVLKINSEIEEIKKESVFLDDLVKNVVLELNNIGTPFKPIVSVEYFDVSVFSDFHMLSRALHNILLNAVQAGGRDAKIWIGLKKLGKDEIWISIGNSGSRIAEDNLEKIFTPFYTHGKVNGTGLGLSIVKKIISTNGGEIYAESGRSEDLGDFVIFNLSLPLLPRGQSELNKTTKFPAVCEPDLRAFFRNNKLKEIQLLLTDDCYSYCNYLEMLPAKSPVLAGKILLDYVYSVSSAIEMNKKKSYDIHLVDIDLGSGGNGAKLARELLKIDRKSFVCFHSDTDPNIFRAQFLDLQNCLFIEKPMTVEKFVFLVESWIEYKEGL